MPKTVTIEPVTRIEGHAKVTVHLGDDGKVEQARMHVVEFRGFEKFCEGRHFSEMPSITARICGICPISHHLAASKAGDAILGVPVPPTAHKLRELMHMGQILQSHALSFFHLSAPDLLLGFDADPAKRNIIGLIEEKPQIALQGIQLRKFGQEIIARVGGRRIHPTFSLPGGVNQTLAPGDRDAILEGIPAAIAGCQAAIGLIKAYYAENAEDVARFANFPSPYGGLVTAEGALEHYDGYLRFVGADGGILEDGVDPAEYLSVIAETTEDWSYLKFPYYKKIGYPEGAYRVGPLGRLNIAESARTPLANEELRAFKALGNGKPVEGTLYYHYARLIEALYAVERAQQLAEDPEILGSDIVATSQSLRQRGVGVIEAPRGTLFHDYTVDEGGRLEKVNLIVSTGQNNVAMNRAVSSVARTYVDGTQLREGMLNRVEAAIRAYDPCLSCSTHAIGQMPLEVELVGPNGEKLDRVVRG
ncbi:MAG: Ni/Fe hydrogenase subunit alpha [Armatimonadetes bacterium]|jgi:NAD-reducing hydrogenase large subunit|nr:Ni/Fe hydrogenase subunit alpha [Armatimonadota bacterium]